MRTVLGLLIAISPMFITDASAQTALEPLIEHLGGSGPHARSSLGAKVGGCKRVENPYGKSYECTIRGSSVPRPFSAAQMFLSKGRYKLLTLEIRGGSQKMQRVEAAFDVLGISGATQTKQVVVGGRLIQTHRRSDGVAVSFWVERGGGAGAMLSRN